MTEECVREMFIPVAVCPRCNRKLTVYELHSTYKQNWLLRHELFRRLVYECKYCRCELTEQDFIKKSVNIKGVGNMDIKNLTESEQQDFYRLLKKMDGQETDKKQDAKVKKPKYGDTVYYINYVGEIARTTWLNVKRDSKMWELGNVFFTEEAAEFAREKKKVEVELERYAKKHNGPTRSDSFYLSYNDGRDEKLDYEVWSVRRPLGAVPFTSKQVLDNAIEAVGKDRILKYIFGVESEEEDED